MLQQVLGCFSNKLIFKKRKLINFLIILNLRVLEQENELTNCYEGKSTEASNMVSLKTQLISYIKNNISLSAADTSKDNETVANANIEQYLQDFRDQVLTVKGSYYYTGQDCQADSSVWNFPNALLFTVI